MTLECFIRLHRANEQNDLLHAPTKKKFKGEGETRTPAYQEVDYWLELAKCSRSIGNYADIRGIFAQLPTLKPITLKAIEEESQKDFLSALNSYVTALEENRLTEANTHEPTLELEQEFWTQSMLNCCNQLSNWTLMSKHIFLDSVTFDSLWSDVQQLNLLMPSAIRAKLKLLISGSEQEQLDQEDLCQFFNHLSTTSNTNSTVESTLVKRQFIEQQYPFELATFFLYQKDFDRSKYYIHFAKEQFLLRWSTLSRLSDYGRKMNIQSIQPYHELDQFLSFIEQNLPLLKSLENRYLTDQTQETNTRDRFLERFHADLLSQWQLPDPIRSSIQTWDDIVTNRGLFLDIVDDLLGGARMSFTCRAKAREFDPIVIDWKVQSALDMADCALQQRNYKLALTKLNETRSRLDQCVNPLLKSIYWNEIYCGVHLKRHQTSLPSLLSTLVAKELKKMETKITSLEILDASTARLNSRYNQLNSLFCRTVIDFLLVQPQAYRNYEQDERISPAKHQQLEIYLDQPSADLMESKNLVHELFHKGVQQLQENISKQETQPTKETLLSADYNELASFCDDYLRRFENHEDDDHLLDHLFSAPRAEQIADLIVQSILSSMKYGSNQGVQRFSRLLQIVELYPGTLQSISHRLPEIPCWMFFDCLYQITAHLDKPIGLKLYPVLEEIVKCYPQSIVYPFKLSYETLQSSSKRHLEVLRQRLDRSTPLVNEFIQALNQLNPQQQLENWLKELFQLLSNDPATRDCHRLREHLLKFKESLFSDLLNLDETEPTPDTSSTSQDSVFGDGIDRRPVKARSTSIRLQFKNAVEKDLEQLFGAQGDLFASVSLATAKTVLSSLAVKLKNISQEKTNINDYSTWFSSTFRQQHRLLSSLSTRELEIPGQYTSRKKPLLDHHIKIVGFDEKLLILHSLRVPKRLTIRGHDENDYRFLVKAGEDLRQDQRLQALFHMMNDLYDHDANCQQSNSARINVRTYQGKPFIDDHSLSHSHL